MWMKGMDGIDNKIINLLLEDGRMSYSEIAKHVGLTRTAVKNRITALEGQGVIAGYRAVVKPQSAPQSLTFVVNIETTAEAFEQTKEQFVQFEEALTVAQTTGNCRLMAICLAPDVKTMRELLNGVCQTINGITSITAHAILDVAKGTIIPKR